MIDIALCNSLTDIKFIGIKLNKNEQSNLRGNIMRKYSKLFSS